MNHPEIMAAKMICKSIDALTREIYLLRKSMEEKAQPKQEEKENQIPPWVWKMRKNFLLLVGGRGFQL